MNTTIRSICLPLLGLLCLAACAGAAERVYQLTIARGMVNFTGTPRHAMTINGGIPGPVLRFREGDEAVLHVRNDMDVPTSIHWHGLLVPPDQDGVPFISYPPIAPGTTFTYRFPIRQAGTYWYHSHSSLQEQRGVYGGIVIEPRQKRHRVSREHVVMLSDWTDMDPHRVMRLLRRGSEAMGVRKHTAQSLLGAWKTGKTAEFWKREAMRMPPMDLADVAYDAFLVNGRRDAELRARPGETVRLRIIDGSASSFFHLRYAGGPMTIIAADGQDVRPERLDEPLLIGVAETYDVLVKVPGKGACELRATAHDGSGHGSLWIGSGGRRPVEDMPMPFVYDTMDMFDWGNLFAPTPAGTMGMPDREVEAGRFDQPGMNMPGMGHGGMDHDGMQHGGMDRKQGMKPMSHGVTRNPPRWYDFLLREDAARAPLLADDSMMSKQRPFPPYQRLRAVKRTAFDRDAPVREIRLTLDGDMGRYVWMFNNQPLKPENDILVRRGEVVRFIFINRTMMHHPLHLHGHFFRVINRHGAYSPLKHTVDVAPMTTTVIEFLANEVGDWFFHCHLLYHMKAGMARVVRYEGFTNDPETEALAHKRYDQHWYLFARADLLSNMTQGELLFENQRNTFSLGWEAGWRNVDGVDLEWEAEFAYERYLNRFTTVFAGVYAEGFHDGGRGPGLKSETERMIAGIHHTLPLNFMSKLWIDSDGEARIAIERELMLTPRLGIFGEVEYDTREKWSWQAGASWLCNENVALTALYDSHYGFGAGVTLAY